MGPLPGIGSDGLIEESEDGETALSTGKKLVLLVLALVIFHLIALIYGVIRLYRNSGATTINGKAVKVRTS